MSITVRYFASLKELVGRSEEIVADAAGSTVGDLWFRLNPSLPLPDNTLTAVNMEYAAIDAPVKDGDEVAFFPPVTGG
ncbi:MAG: MoaD/ThiS family protein [Gammaproteobacteria bacterium]